ncbi:MAG: TonB-dependent receptor plug domain-containing protein [Bacteroidales bacterium]|jgi:iron complex outermembrane receptor protein|nr:TonB-dependent receptor plug domain-containing protein [Bacteroidales bacterium]
MAFIPLIAKRMIRRLIFSCLSVALAGQLSGQTETLPPDTVRSIEEVSIYGRKRTSPLLNLTVEPLAWETSITYITSEEHRKTGAVNLFDALKYSVNGMPSTQGRRKKHYYLLRGQNMAADYAVNGVSLSTNGAGPMAEWVEAPSLLPAAMIESVEVVRSGNSLLLGFSGLNGVVNIKTKTFDDFITQAEVEYGTFNSLRFGVLHGGKTGNDKTGRLHYALSLFNSSTDGPKGRHSKENLWNIYGKAEYKYKDRIEFALENFYTYGTRYVTQAVFDSLAAPQSQLADLWEYDPMRYNVATARLKINESAKASTELQLSHILNRMDLYPDRYYFTSSGSVVQIADSIKRNHMLDEPDSIFTAAVFQAFSPVRNNVLRAGVMFASSANYAHGMSKKKILSATLLDQHTFGQTDIHAGVKFIREYYEYYVPGQGFGDAAQAVSDEWQPALFGMSAGVSHQRGRRTLNIVINSGMLPVDKTALQLLTGNNGAPLMDETTGKPLVGGLQREIRTGAELGWKHHIEERGHIIWTLFLMNQKNTSEFTKTPYYDDRNVLRYYMRNINLATYGIEVSFHSLKQMGCLSASGNVSYKYVRRKDPSSRKHYTKQPPFIANATVSFSKSTWEANLMGKYVSQYRTDRFLREEVNTGNYFNFDANLTCSIPRTPLQIFASMMNIFDWRYATVSPLYPDFGRQMKIGMRAVF